MAPEVTRLLFFTKALRVRLDSGMIEMCHMKVENLQIEAGEVKQYHLVEE
jgi:hypothetical protein